MDLGTSSWLEANNERAAGVALLWNSWRETGATENESACDEREEERRAYSQTNERITH